VVVDKTLKENNESYQAVAAEHEVLTDVSNLPRMVFLSTPGSTSIHRYLISIMK